MTNVTILPTPGAVAPAEGVGVTLHHAEGQFPCTIVRAGPRAFWFRLDADFPGVARLSPSLRSWTFRAVLQPDGAWREEQDMLRVDVGVRRIAFDDPARWGTPGNRSADQLVVAVDRIEPRLLKRRWYPMTYMAIPSVLRSADELLAELGAYSGPEQERVSSARERLTRLRSGFKNLGGGDASTEEVE